MKTFLVLLFLMPPIAQSGPIHYLYYGNMYGHLHQGPSSYSDSLKSLTCGDRVQLIQDKSGVTTEFSRFSWVKIKYGPNEGFIRAEFLDKSKPKCFQAKYIKFFNQFKIELNDVFTWGRLYDQYVTGSSKVR
ncbi:MAG: SH3 domain-containing protein [Deltaproteobacteria bacterium]|nr:MAG: SH3 domain-containing protein [Deltaproteobacteria bacterium]